MNEAETTVYKVINTKTQVVDQKITVILLWILYTFSPKIHYGSCRSEQIAFVMPKAKTKQITLLTLVLSRGGGVVTNPLAACLRLHKNAKGSDPGHLGHLFYIICSHFDEKKNGGIP